MRNPLVSIVIPVYNGANYLGSAIESALSQTWSPLEVLVINDGSTDGGATAAVARNFEGRIRYFEKPNGGVASALNCGIAQMRGELFSWLSHDDMYKPGKVEAQVAAWREFGKPCIVIGDVDVIDESGKYLWSYGAGGYNLAARPLDAVFRALINGCALLVPRSLFDKVGLFETGLPTTQDYHLWYRMARAVPFVHCERNDVMQRVHSGQASNDRLHLLEGGRMFAHLLHQTPPEIMRAYAGSEIRFLRNVESEPKLKAYAGLGAYITERMNRIAFASPYALVLSPEIANPREESSVASWRYAPACVVDSAADPAVQRYSVVVFSPSCSPVQENVEAAVRALVAEDAAVAVPDARPALASPLLGVAARREHISALECGMPEAVAGAVTYRPPRPWPVLEIEEVDRALRGEAALQAGGGISPDALIQHLRAGADVPLQVVICQLSPQGSSPVLRAWLETEAAACRLLLFDTSRSDSVRCIGAAGMDKPGGLIFAYPEQLHLCREIAAAGSVTLWYDGDLSDASIDMASSPTLRTVVGDYGITRTETVPIRDRALMQQFQTIALGDDLAVRVGSLLSGAAVSAAPLPAKLRPRIKYAFLNRCQPGETVRIAIRGSLLARKAERRLILETAREAAARMLPFRFHILGDAPLALHAGDEESLTVHPAWTPESNGEVLGAVDPHLAWLPVATPDYWADEILWACDSCLPLAASGTDTIAAITAGRPYTWLYPLGCGVEDWLGNLLKLHAFKLQKQPTQAWSAGVPGVVD